MLGPDVATGSLVLIREEHVPPTKWMMGRVVEVHRGKDELVLVVSIRTRTGILKRPLVKLALLPVPPRSISDVTSYWMLSPLSLEKSPTSFRQIPYQIFFQRRSSQASLREFF
ncbi:hypothetical protein LAZ67_15000490 [Cordylochernes scorpioides]|uniref:DUF5641 domain-containing protein n=1 Tax=Cordylochernes scorpioides TaxID=51811 RepID=A0ABY6L8F4_9ARAC|nr:hypothetical protein LAZ67_15000490 [Cordylochernes scorpioides]